MWRDMSTSAHPRHRGPGLLQSHRGGGLHSRHLFLEAESWRSHGVGMVGSWQEPSSGLQMGPLLLCPYSVRGVGEGGSGDRASFLVSHKDTNPIRLGPQP